MNNEYNEYETFEMEIKGEVIELAIEEEFEVEEQRYILASKVEGDTICEEESYIFKLLDIEEGISIEKITEMEEYEKVTNAYMNRE